jgi:uncharacterized membrane protein YpjA
MARDETDLAPDTLLISIFALVIGMAWNAAFNTFFNYLYDVDPVNDTVEEVWTRMGYALLVTLFGAIVVRYGVRHYRRLSGSESSAKKADK